MRAESPGRRALGARLARVAPEVGAALLAAAVSAGSVGAGFLGYDDPHFVLEPEVVRAPSLRAVGETLAHPVWGSYHPLHILSYALEARLFGLERPWAFHATNVLLYALCAALVVRLARRFGLGSRAALAAGLVFAAHPSHVESVAWVTGRKDVLSGALVLAALLGALRPPRGAREKIEAFGLFLLALAAKTLAYVLAPFLALEAWFERRLGRRETLALAPFLALALGWVALELAAQKSLGAVQPLRHGSLAAQLRYAAWSFAWYPRRFLWPAPLTPRPELSLPDALGLGDLAVALELLAFAGTLAWLGRRRDRAALFLAWFALALAPVTNLVPSPASVQDRYLFLPSVGAALLVGDLLERALLGRGRKRALAGSVALALVVAVGGFESARYTRAWRSDLALWTEAVRAEPANGISHLGLAGSLLATGDVDAAAREAERAHDLGTGSLARAFQARIAQARGRPEEARAFAADGWASGGGADLGTLLVRAELDRGETARARTLVADLEARFPRDGWTALARAEVAHVAGDLDAAADAYAEAARKLDAPEAWLGLEQVERARGRLDLAARALASAGRAGAPPAALGTEGAALALATGDFAAAERLAREVVARDPHASARHWLGLALAGQGRLREAEATLDALAREARDPFVLYDLARIRSRAGDLAGAREALDSAAAARPDLRSRAAGDPLLRDLQRP